MKRKAKSEIWPALSPKLRERARREGRERVGRLNFGRQQWHSPRSITIQGIKGQPAKPTLLLIRCGPGKSAPKRPVTASARFTAELDLIHHPERSSAFARSSSSLPFLLHLIRHSLSRRLSGARTGIHTTIESTLTALVCLRPSTDPSQLAELLPCYHSFLLLPSHRARVLPRTCASSVIAHPNPSLPSSPSLSRLQHSKPSATPSCLAAAGDS